MFSHGWPLSADDWDAQMLFFLNHGYRVIAHDRRGHGRSTQTSDGHDMDHYADDLAALTAHLDLKNAIHVGHSTGGGEVVRYLARHGESRVAKAAIISAVPPLMVKTPANPGGLPKEVFDGLPGRSSPPTVRSSIAISPSGPFYGFNRPGVKSSEAIIENWWRQGMMGGAKAHYDGIVAFSQTDFTDDLKRITVPVLVMHSEDDQIVPYVAAGPAVGKAAEERNAQDLQGLPARHDHDAGRDDQRRPAGVLQGLSQPASTLAICERPGLTSWLQLTSERPMTLRQTVAPPSRSRSASSSRRCRTALAETAACASEQAAIPVVHYRTRQGRWRRYLLP